MARTLDCPGAPEGVVAQKAVANSGNYALAVAVQVAGGAPEDPAEVR